MARRFSMESFEEAWITANTFGEDLSDQFAELARTRSGVVLEQWERILSDVGRELILIHENEMSVRLLSQQHQQVCRARTRPAG